MAHWFSGSAVHRAASPVLHGEPPPPPPRRLGRHITGSEQPDQAAQAVLLDDDVGRLEAELRRSFTISAYSIVAPINPATVTS